MEAPVEEEGAMEEATMDEAGAEAGVEAGLEGRVRETRRERCVRRKGCACEPGSAEARASAHTAEVHPAASHGMHSSSETATMHPASKAAAVHATSKPTTAAVKGKRRRSNGKRHDKGACGEAFCEPVAHRRILRC
jgi:hypothetical protein